MMADRCKPACFKAYDIRGQVPGQLDENLARRIGLAAARAVGTGRWAVGWDCRLSSPGLAAALAGGLAAGGADVVELGMCGTEQVYHAVFSLALAGGIMVTASHNPVGDNGMKLVREGARPLSGDSGLDELGALTLDPALAPASRAGTISAADPSPEYIAFLLEQVDVAGLRPLRIVADSGNGCAGPIIDRLAASLPFEFIRLRHEPDGTFPQGVPNPLLPENRGLTAEAVRRHGADLGLAWDGDFDRCFFFDERGEFVEGYYLVGLLAAATLRRRPGARIVHDPRLTWNTVDVVTRLGGVPVLNKTGHAFMKERMRAEDAAYGGEMSAHHYFREFAFCDSGMLPWLLVAQEMARTGRPLSALVGEMQRAYPASGEINRRLADPAAAIARVEARWLAAARAVDRTDGLSLAFDTWRFNLRMSNTEPVLRLNVETRADPGLLRTRTDELLALIDGPV
jgi:phosphomannomutase/phosphomannomutase/phosphoglucomutase